MNVISFERTGLGNSSYLVDIGGGRAVAVDPDRTAQRYMTAAEQRGLRIVAALETHVHADFVSGARELAAAGADIHAPAESELRFPYRGLRAGERLNLDGVQVEAIASPGHTPEHLSYVLRAAGRAPALFSGGSLIVGGAARTDLITPEMTEPLTRAQFRTLHKAFGHLPDETELYPTHGGGSFCSVGATSESTSTLGEERRSNPLLAMDDEEDFVRSWPATFPAAPAYFFRMRAFNQAGPRLRREIPLPPPLSADEFEHALRGGALVIDVRSKEEYAERHIRNAIHIAFGDAYATWLGWLVPPEAQLLFVLDDAPLEDVFDESLLVGYEHLGGWLAGGVDAWGRSGRELRRTATLDVRTARRQLADGVVALDVREPDEHDSGHIEGARHIPLGSLQEGAATLPKDRPLLVYCAHGDRASTAISVLERAGFESIASLAGGYEAWRREA